MNFEAPLIENREAKLYRERASFEAEKYLLVGGINLENLVTLAKIGILDLKKIKIHISYVLEIWDKIKEKYLLSKGLLT